MKMVVLWSSLSGYMSACLKKFIESYKYELMMVVKPIDENAPYNPEEFKWIPSIINYSSIKELSYIKKKMVEFNPDVILMSSWSTFAYLYFTRSRAFNKIPRIAMADNQWLGTARQYISIFISRFYLKPSIDCLFVSGERQAEFSRRLGYDRNSLVTGCYSCDTDLYKKVFEIKKKTRLSNVFIYIGRMVKEKGILDLVKAYEIYRKNAEHRYPLVCFGEGPLTEYLKNIKGIILKKFVQPSDLPMEYIKADCLICPSIFEPWGMVIHEACTAGLAIICTRVCGAAVHLVQDDFNGFVVRPNNPKEIADAMLTYSIKSENEKRNMSYRSHLLSKQFSSTRWADALNRAIKLASLKHI